MEKKVGEMEIGTQTEAELKEKKLRAEDALNDTKAGIEKGIIVGAGCMHSAETSIEGGYNQGVPWQ
ncbi:unnamed protein product [Lupinus luteus]|uniref:Uncharacterized protein n=1 Tax=Lupinus luteus TaxID=3873 RepID=A0AAV1YII9_LUPLU